MDNRALSERISAMADRYRAISIGYSKRYNALDRGVTIQDIMNADRDSSLLTEVAEILRTIAL